MEYELTCLYGYGHTPTADFREGAGVLAMEHMDDEHDTPVDPLETDELALKRLDSASPRQARR